MNLPIIDELRDRARQALQATGADVGLGEPGGHGLPASTPITGEVLFTVAHASPEQADHTIAEAADAFSAWRSTPAPVRGALVARLGELLAEHKNDLATLVTLEVGKITAEGAGRSAGNDRHLPVRRSACRASCTAGPSRPSAPGTGWPRPGIRSAWSA